MQSLDAVIMQVFDKDHSGSVTLKETDSTLTALGSMVGGMRSPGDSGGGPSEIEGMIQSAKDFAPTLFNLLDGDGSKTLDKKELLWVTKFQKVLQSGALRNLTRDVFAALDTDEDGSVTTAESETEDAAQLASIVELVQAVLPLPNLLVDTADAAQRDGLRKHLKHAMGMLDADSDGAVTKLEAGKAFKSFRLMFLKAAKNLHGHLVVIHGTMDDNVHVQNAMQLIWALQSAGKQNFELMLYPRSRHGLNRAVSGHSRELQWLRLKKLLAR